MQKILFFLFCIFTFSCLSRGKSPHGDVDTGDLSIKIYDFPTEGKHVIVIDSILDLQGKCYRVPYNLTLRFKGGTIVNGTLIGQKTKIVGSEKLFDHVVIKGTWDVDSISTKMFCNLRDINSLKNIFALADANTHNVIHIQKGNYYVKATKENPRVLNVPSKTKLIIDGTIMMTANDLKSYSILVISKANDVAVLGNGELIGDRDTHTGNGGEWGMCISTYNADNISINGLSLSKGWGDGIYIGKGTKKVTISNCKLDNCRRQGISVIEGSDVLIKDCIITNIHGTDPEYAIDIEPNAKNFASNIIIRNVIARNCRGGFAIYTGKNNGSHVENVCIENCSVIGNKKSAFSVHGAKGIVLKNNAINDSSTKYAFDIQRSANVEIIGNTISTQQDVINNLKNVKMKGNMIRKGKRPFMKKE